MKQWTMALIGVLLTVCGVAPLWSVAHAGAAPAAGGAKFVLRSSAVADGGALPVEFTGDGAGVTLPLEWSGVPDGTKSFAVVMHHMAPDRTKWYWVLYGIPPDVHGLARNVKDVGVFGNNSVNNRREYAPPKSKGPGVKTYIYTLYALSSAPQIDVPLEDVSRDVLLAAMKGKVLGTAELRVSYSRPVGGTGNVEDRPPAPPARP